MENRTRILLEKMHQRQGLPRLEIRGLLTPSVIAVYLGCFSERFGNEDRAIYIINDWVDESGGDSDYDIKYLFFPRHELEKLANEALESEHGIAVRCIPAKEYKHRETWHHFSGYHAGGDEEINDVEARLILFLRKELRFCLEVEDGNNKGWIFRR